MTDDFIESLLLSLSPLLPFLLSFFFFFFFLFSLADAAAAVTASADATEARAKQEPFATDCSLNRSMFVQL